MKKSNNNVFLIMFKLCLIIITFVVLLSGSCAELFKYVWDISYVDVIGCEYCDSDTLSSEGREENEISINNSHPLHYGGDLNALQSEDDIIVGSEDNVEDDREHITSSLSLLSKVKIFKDKSLTSSKRRLLWSLWERHKDRYGSYKEFKESWDPNQSIRNEIKNYLKHVQKDLQHKIEKIRHQKRIIVYFYTRNRRHRT